MKTIYLLAAVMLCFFTGCQQTAKSAPEMEDTYALDTAQIEEAYDETTADTTSPTTSSEVKLPDTISVKTTRLKTDTSNKFALAGTQWKLVELNGKEVKNDSDKDYVLTMNSKTGKITSNVGCNSIMGSYLMKEGNSITFLYVGATKMACPDMKLEDKYIRMLQKVDKYMIEGNMLHLHKGDKKALAKFEAIP